MARVIKSMGIKMVLSGEGADEVFGGYLYFHKAPNSEEFHKETVRKISKLHLYDCLRANKSLAAWGIEGRVPFLDKEFVKAEQLSNNDRPINQNWSWDKILRSVFIKQADVLQGLYFFEEHFDIQTIKENIEFYEPYTVHESSLSACIHSILYSLVKEEEQAYKMFLQTVRLDLDDYNKEVDEGLHITSMPGSWLSIVEGFAGLRIRNNKLFLNPTLPNKWKSYSFNIIFNDQIVNFDIRKDKILIYNKGGNSIDLSINGRDIQILENNKIKIEC